VPYVTKNAQIENLTTIAQERLEEIDKLQKENKKLKKDRDERQEITAAAFDRENTYRWQREALESYRKLPFKAADVWELSSQLTLNDIDTLLTIFRDRITVEDVESPFTHETDECEAFSCVDRALLVICQTIQPAHWTNNLYSESSFAEWLKYAPRNVKSDYDESNADELGTRVKINFWMEDPD
jgi:hypothetical protein